MKAHNLRVALDEIAALEGVAGCALVDLDAGMLWMEAGELRNITRIGEATSDYWRLHTRLSDHFNESGRLRALIMMHEHEWISLFPCTDGTLLVAVTRDQRTVDWKDLQRRVGVLAATVRKL